MTVQETLSSIITEYTSLGYNFQYQHITPATTGELVHFEEHTGLKLPDDFKTFLITNQYAFYVAFNYQFLSIQQILDNWNMMKEHLDNGTFNERVANHEKNGFTNWQGNYFQKTWWSTSWIPFATDSCGNMHCIDCNPGQNGHLYQIIDMEIQDGQGPYLNTRYSDFKDCLGKNLQYLQNKQYYLETYDNEVEIQIDPYIKAVK